jgi:hypothetical protein
MFAFFILPETRGRPLWDTFEEMIADEKKQSKAVKL